MSLAESGWFAPYPLRPVWIHMLVLGWMTQWIFAISLWMFPRSKDGYQKRETKATWSLLGAWNVALLLRLLFEVDELLFNEGVRKWGLTLSVVLFWVAALLYLREIWPRIRVKKRQYSRK